MPAVRVGGERRRARRGSVRRSAAWATQATPLDSRALEEGSCVEVEDARRPAGCAHEAREHLARPEVHERVRARAARARASSRASAPASRSRPPARRARRRTAGRSSRRSRAPRAGETRRLERGAKRLDGAGHGGRVKGARDVEQDRAHAVLARLARGRAQPARSDRRARPDRARCRWPPPPRARSARRADLLLGCAEDGEHAFVAPAGRASHQLAAANRQRRPDAGSSAPAATSALSSPSEWPASATGRTSARALLPAGDARAEDRRLGEPGALAHARERVLADERDALAPAAPGRRARRARAERSCWLPWPGKRPAMTPVDTSHRFAVRRRPGAASGARTAHMGGPVRAPGGVLSAASRAGAQRCRPRRCARWTASARLRAPSLR